VSGTKAVWLLALALVGAAVALLFLPESTSQLPAVEPLAAPTVVAPTTVPQNSSFVGPPSPTTSAAAVNAPSVTAPPLPRPPRAAVVRAPNAVSDGLDLVVPGATIAAGNIVPAKDQESGEEYLLADGRYQIRGKGTFEDPYRVSWECLASVSDTFIPRLKEYEIPQRVAMLHNKWLRIDGYLWFPLMLSETKALVVMLNQWDGCCIGVPPSPYDAIEVKLLEAARRTGGHATFQFGGVKGKFKLDPYLPDDFLAGLYVLDDSQLIQNTHPEL
jgi:hypothetical protein